MTALPRLPWIDPETATGVTAELLAEAQRTLGITPNLVKVLANSPAALRGYLDMCAALCTGEIPAATRERIALLVAQENGSDYGLSAHTYVATRLVGLTPAQVEAARDASGDDPRTTAMLTLARALVRCRGALPDAEVAAARAVLTDAEFTELVAHVTLAIFGNYLALAGRVPVDWPLVRHDDDRHSTNPDLIDESGQPLPHPLPHPRTGPAHA